ncbi:hypothetical protein IAU59_003004 [Kwoniella sp. CBS 9459]
MPLQLPPAAPGGPTAFGASSVHSSGTKDDGGKKKAKRREGEDGGALSFLNDTVCVICNEGVVPGAQKGRTHYMTSCGHVLCDKPEHNNKPKVCTACGKAMTAVPIQQGQLPADLERWFADPQYEMNDIFLEQQKLAKRINSVREVVKAENARLRSEMESLLKENEAFKSNSVPARNTHPAQLEQGSARGTIQPRGSYGGGQNQRLSRESLPTVQEEGDYEVDDHYSGDRNGAADGGNAMRTILGKRHSSDAFEDTSARFPPQPSSGRASVMGRPAGPPSASSLYSNEVMTTPRRSMSVAGYRGNQLSGINSRPDLESYRMDAPPSTPRQYQSEPLDRRSMTPMQRASSARPYVQNRTGQMLPPSGYPQGPHQGQGNQHGGYRHQHELYQPDEQYQPHIQYELDQQPADPHRDIDRPGSAIPQSGRTAGTAFNLASRPTTRMPPPF